ncbi:hypothetical protein P7C73_g1027, partial [Tremellales sp. Uapishka_1]
MTAMSTPTSLPVLSPRTPHVETFTLLGSRSPTLETPRLALDTREQACRPTSSPVAPRLHTSDRPRYHVPRPARVSLATAQPCPDVDPSISVLGGVVDALGDVGMEGNKEDTEAEPNEDDEADEKGPNYLCLTPRRAIRSTNPSVSPTRSEEAKKVIQGTFTAHSESSNTYDSADEHPLRSNSALKMTPLPEDDTRPEDALLTPPTECHLVHPIPHRIPSGALAAHLSDHGDASGYEGEDEELSAEEDNDDGFPPPAGAMGRRKWTSDLAERSSSEVAEHSSSEDEETDEEPCDRGRQLGRPRARGRRARVSEQAPTHGRGQVSMYQQAEIFDSELDEVDIDALEEQSDAEERIFNAQGEEFVAEEPQYLRHYGSWRKGENDKPYFVFFEDGFWEEYLWSDGYSHRSWVQTRPPVMALENGKESRLSVEMRRIKDRLDRERWARKERDEEKKGKEKGVDISKVKDHSYGSRMPKKAIGKNMKARDELKKNASLEETSHRLSIDSASKPMERFALIDG